MNKCEIVIKDIIICTKTTRNLYFARKSKNCADKFKMTRTDDMELKHDKLKNENDW